MMRNLDAYVKFERPAAVEGRRTRVVGEMSDRGVPRIGLPALPRVTQKRMMALPQVNPAPKAPVARICPRWSRPLRTHSSRAIGIEAAVVFP